MPDVTTDKVTRIKNYYLLVRIVQLDLQHPATGMHVLDPQAGTEKVVLTRGRRMVLAFVASPW